MTIFETQRLLVRYLQDDDFDAFYILCSDPEINRYMGDGQPLTPELTRKWIEVSNANYQKRGYGCFAITSQQDGQMLGFGGLIYAPGSSQAEIIYAFKPSRWGQGLASEFAGAMLATGFERWQLPSIAASIDARNPASIRIVEKAGMTYVRTEVEENDLSVVWYALTIEEFHRSLSTRP